MELHHDAFDPDEQAEIVRLAAVLQSSHQDRMNVSQIEEVALEAGINPEYVRLAAQTVRDRRNIEPSAQRALLVAPLNGRGWVVRVAFALFQILMISKMMAWGYVPIGPLVLIGCVVALIYGIALSKYRGGYGEVARRILWPSLALSLAIGPFRAMAGTLRMDWWPGVPAIVLFELICAMVGYSVGLFITDRFRRNSQPELH
ncbi:MAG: hypothetical protein ABL949_11225 [Fimbriimonadaceae bacterium]